MTSVQTSTSVPRRDDEGKQKDEEDQPSKELSHLFATNDAPTSMQQSQLRASLETLLKKSAEFDDAVETAERRVKALKADRERLLDQVLRHKAALAPIRNLPKDMLQEILRAFAADQPTEAKELDSFDLKRGVWPLGQVCSAWRQEVHGMPTLWSRIVIKPNPARHSPSILSSIIERSKCVPLHVSFESNTNTKVSRNLLQQLCAQSHRWESLRICIPYSLTSCLSAVKDSLPILEELYYGLVDHDGSTEDSTFANAPKLKEVELGYRDLDSVVPLHLKLPPDTVLGMTLISMMALVLPIQRMIPSSVVDLTIIVPHAQVLPSPTPLLLPNAEELRIPHTVLQAVESPDISMLAVYGDIGQEFCDALNIFVTHSGNFEYMILQPTSYSLDVFDGFLDPLDFILTLELDDLMCLDRGDFLFVVKEFLRLMVVKDGQDLLPSLTRFRLYFQRHEADRALLELAYEVIETRELEEFEYIDRSIKSPINLDTIDEFLGLEGDSSEREEEG